MIERYRREIEMQRTWDAEIIVDRERIPATISEWDLLDDQTKSAVREAALFVDDAREVHVDLFKTTQARGRQFDRSFIVYRDVRRGGVVYSR